MLPLALALAAASPAHAADPGLDVEVHAGALVRPEIGLATANVRLLGRRDAYLEVDGRAGPAGDWLGRAGVGVDLLGGARWHAQVGGFLGGRGQSTFLSPQLIAGPQVTFGFDNHRVYARWSAMVASGVTGQHSGVYGERNLLVGFRVVDELRVYGRVLHAGDLDTHDTWAGMGVGYFF